MPLESIAEVLRRLGGAFGVPLEWVLDKSHDNQLTWPVKRLVQSVRRQVLVRSEAAQARRLRQQGLSDKEILDHLSPPDPDCRIDPRQLGRWLHDKSIERKWLDGGGFVFLRAPEGGFVLGFAVRASCQGRPRARGKPCGWPLYVLQVPLARGTDTTRTLRLGEASLSSREIVAGFANITASSLINRHLEPPPDEIPGYCRRCRQRRGFLVAEIRLIPTALYREWLAAHPQSKSRVLAKLFEWAVEGRRYETSARASDMAKQCVELLAEAMVYRRGDAVYVLAPRPDLPALLPDGQPMEIPPDVMAVFKAALGGAPPVRQTERKQSGRKRGAPT